MNIKQIEKLESVLKILGKAKWDNLIVADQYENVKILNDFAMTIKELRDEMNGAIKINKKDKIE